MIQTFSHTQASQNASSDTPDSKNITFSGSHFVVMPGADYIATPAPTADQVDRAVGQSNV